MLVLEVYHKKLHYLNDTEKSWDMDKSISTCTFSIVKQCSHTKNKNFIIKVIAKSPTFALLLCPFFYFSYIIHYLPSADFPVLAIFEPGTLISIAHAAKDDQRPLITPASSG